MATSLLNATNGVRRNFEHIEDVIIEPVSKAVKDIS